jgi:hypothetical protein
MSTNEKRGLTDAEAAACCHAPTEHTKVEFFNFIGILNPTAVLSATNHAPH